MWCESHGAAERLADALHRELQDAGYAWALEMLGAVPTLRLALNNLRSRQASRRVRQAAAASLVLDTFSRPVPYAPVVGRDGSVETARPPVHGAYERLASAEIVELCYPVALRERYRRAVVAHVVRGNTFIR